MSPFRCIWKPREQFVPGIPVYAVKRCDDEDICPVFPKMKTEKWREDPSVMKRLNKIFRVLLGMMNRIGRAPSIRICSKNSNNRARVSCMVSGFVSLYLFIPCDFSTRLWTRNESRLRIRFQACEWVNSNRTGAMAYIASRAFTPGRKSLSVRCNLPLSSSLKRPDTALFPMSLLK